MTTSKRRAIDLLRREKTFERKAEQYGRDLQERDDGSEFDPVYEEIDDDILRLMFMACHPVL